MGSDHRLFRRLSLVEGALVRFLVRSGENPRTATVLPAALEQSTRCELWPDTLSYHEVSLVGVTGHRQVTDTYLTSVAASRGAALMTFDRALVHTHPENSALIP